MSIDLGRDIVISDDELNQLNQNIISYFEYYTNKLKEYISIIDSLASKGIPSGVVHDNLEIYIESANKLNVEIAQLKDTITKSNIKLIEDLDIADDCLFLEGKRVYCTY